jgi:dihydropteroate synthase
MSRETIDDDPSRETTDADPNGDRDRGLMPARPDLGGGRSTPAVTLPEGATNGLPDALGRTRIGRRVFTWGARTYVMGIVNVTPDSFSGDGLLRDQVAPATMGAGLSGHRPPVGADPIARAVAIAASMVEAGADLLDVGGESTRPGHERVDEDAERARVVPVIEAIRRALPDVAISIDTTKAGVAAAAIDAGADLVNDVWGVAADDALARLAADRGVPIVLMHNRAEARYTTMVAEVIADLQRAIERALAAGVPWSDIIVDPGFGFGKTAEHNLALLRELPSLAILGRPILLGTSRKSTLGRVLDLPADQRLEATLATTALGIAAGVDIIRVHDVRENVRAARMADAVVRGTWSEGEL